MNNKLLLQDLIDQLAEAGKIKKKDAEEFLRAFFKISEDALFEDGIVKIAGLGTLKLVLVDARKSVNVSTGEEFEIREHYKVSFVPDAELKSLVNQPYAHLEPVELDGGIQNNAAPQEKKSLTDKEKSTKNVSSNERRSKMEKPIPSDVPVRSKRKTLAWILFFLLIVLLGVWSWFSNNQRKKEDLVKIKEIEMIDSLQSKVGIKEDLAAVAKDSTAGSAEMLAADKALEDSINTVAQESSSSKPTVTPTAIKTENQVAKAVQQVAKTTQNPVKTTKVEIKKTTTPVQKSTPTVRQEYIATVELTKGNRLTLLSLKYYGDKAFWVYIYQANKDVITNPDNIPAGTKIRIPKPDPKLIDSKNLALIAKAKALQLKILEEK